MPYHRSFQLWSALSPLQSWAQIAAEARNAKGDEALQQVFENDVLGHAYSVRSSGRGKHKR